LICIAKAHIKLIFISKAYIFELYFTGTHKVNLHFNPLPANVENMVSPNNASKVRMGFNSAFKGLNAYMKLIVISKTYIKLIFILKAYIK